MGTRRVQKTSSFFLNSAFQDKDVFSLFCFARRKEKFRQPVNFGEGLGVGGGKREIFVPDKLPDAVVPQWGQRRRSWSWRGSGRLCVRISVLASDAPGSVLGDLCAG